MLPLSLIMALLLSSAMPLAGLCNKYSTRFASVMVSSKCMISPSTTVSASAAGAAAVVVVVVAAISSSRLLRSLMLFVSVPPVVVVMSAADDDDDDDAFAVSTATAVIATEEAALDNVEEAILADIVVGPVVARKSHCVSIRCRMMAMIDWCEYLFLF